MKQRFSLSLIILSMMSLAACSSTGPSTIERPASVGYKTDAAKPINKDVYGLTTMAGGLPAHLLDQPVTVAIMLPLSGDNSALGEAMLNAATMALVDAYDDRITLIPFDTKGSGFGARQAADDVIAADVNIVLGPLFAPAIAAAGPIINDNGLTMIGFSNDSTVAQKGRFIMGFSIGNEVTRVMNYAIEKGHVLFGAMVPQGLYGERVSRALGDIIEEGHAELTAIEVYQRDASAVFDPVRRLANYDVRKREMDRELAALRAIETDLTDDIAKALEKQEVIGAPDFTAVLVPEGGDLLRTISPLLPFYEVDPATVQFLGTGLWNDPSLTREPPLHGGWFAAPDPTKPNAFFDRYKVIFERPAPRIATLAYDAMALVAWLARHPIVEDRFSQKTLMAPQGFAGIDGLFRFKEDGTVERGLAILQINRNGFTVIDRAHSAFPKF